MVNAESTQADGVVDARPKGITEQQDKIIQYVAEYVVNSCNSAQYQSKLRAQTRHNAYFNFLDHSHSYHAYYEYLLQSYRYWKDMETAAQATGGAVGLYSSGAYRDEGYEYYQQQMQQEQQLQQQSQEVYNSSSSVYPRYDNSYRYDDQSNAYPQQVGHYPSMPTDAYSSYSAQQHQHPMHNHSTLSIASTKANTPYADTEQHDRYDAEGSVVTPAILGGQVYNYGNNTLNYDATAVDAHQVPPMSRMHLDEHGHRPGGEYGDEEEEPEYDIVYEDGIQRLVPKTRR